MKQFELLSRLQNAIKLFQQRETILENYKILERNDYNDDVIGRGGALAVHGDIFIVDSSGDRLFMTEIKSLEVSWLMSGDGVIIRGPNLLENGKERTITVHFVYYRK